MNANFRSFQYRHPPLAQSAFFKSAFLAILLAGLAPARADTLYVANNGNSTISKVDDKGVVSALATNISITGACGTVYNYQGDINVLDITRGRVYRITKAGAATILATGMDRPEDMALDSHGVLYVANSDGTIRSVQGNNNSTSNYASIVTSGLDSPRGIAIDGNDVMYVSNFGNGTISKIAPGGSPVTFATGLHGPATLAFSPWGELYVADSSDNEIVKVSAKGVVSTFAKGISTPAQLAFDSHGVLYALDSSGGTILKVDKNGISSVFARGLSTPYGMAFDHPLNKHAPIAPPEPPPPPPPSIGLIIAFSAPAVLILIGGILWLVFRKKEAE